MNWDRIKGNWNQMKGRAKQKWGKVTDDDTTIFTGQRNQLAGKLQEGYGSGRKGRRHRQTHDSSAETSLQFANSVTVGTRPALFV